MLQALHREYRHAPGTLDLVGLMTWDDLNQILATHRLEPPRMRLSHDGETLLAGGPLVDVGARRDDHDVRLLPWKEPAMTGARIMTAEQARTLFDGVAADRMRTEAERWHEFLQERFEEAERRPKHHRLLGEAYGRLAACLDHGDIGQAMEHLDWMRAEAQFFANHQDFPFAQADT
ncbi:hypothetical protein [Streptomyces xylophagus]|uniref:hypothetical protein n=1 Tax=Streptomyces xylophagus TaxID=285514 RepID=UPI0005BCD5DD|nr:hypothetical protein [Streptomyces xylophagus]